MSHSSVWRETGTRSSSVSPSLLLVLGGVNTHVIEHLSYKTIHTYNNIVKGTQRIYVYFRPRGEPTLCSAPIPAIGFSCTLCFDT